jgi:hypothetical protein
MKNKAIVKKYICLFYLLLFFTNCKNETTQTGWIKIKQSTFDVCANDIKVIEYYRKEIDNAVSLLAKQNKIINAELNTNERVEIIAIAFPEIIRYNAFSDLIETTSNRLLYINGGKTASDFSIGLFQMKPSFVEDLENYVSNSEKFKKFKNIQILNKTEKDAREERVRRLENFRWQLRYLKAFWAVMEDKYSQIVFENKNDKLRFYATAYNFGFLRPEKMIINYQNKKAFPYGSNNKKAGRFADFSIDFCNNYNSLFNQ